MSFCLRWKTMKYSSKKDTSFWKLVRSFLHEYMPVIRNLSKSTVSTYKDSLQMFLDFLKEEKNIQLFQIEDEYNKTLNSQISTLKEIAFQKPNPSILFFQEKLHYSIYEKMNQLFP